MQQEGAVHQYASHWRAFVKHTEFSKCLTEKDFPRLVSLQGMLEYWN